MNLAPICLEERLRHAGLSSDDLAKLPGSDWEKVAFARLISAHSAASHQWLADNLKMRSAANVREVLRMKPAEDEAKHLPSPLRRWIKSERAMIKHAL